jgi:hypothetical protein
MLAGLATLSWIVSFILYWVNKGSRPLDYIGFIIIGLILMGLHFYLMWDWRYSWRRTQ